MRYYLQRLVVMVRAALLAGRPYSQRPRSRASGSGVRPV